MKIFKVIIILLFCFGFSKGQEGYKTYKPTPVDEFLRRNADTTIVFNILGNWSLPKPVYYLSKKGDTINFYRYGTYYNYRILAPRNIGDSINKAHRDWDALKMGINRFFNLINVPKHEIIMLWKRVLEQKPWQIKDDVVEGLGCAEYTDDKYISDMAGIGLYLITKNTTKYLYFYSPEYFETKVCKSREGRKAIIAIEKLFEKYFKDEW